MTGWEVPTRMCSRRECCTCSHGASRANRPGWGEQRRGWSFANGCPPALGLETRRESGAAFASSPPAHATSEALCCRRVVACRRPLLTRIQNVFAPSPLLAPSCARPATRTALRLRTTVASRKTTDPGHRGRTVSHLHPQTQSALTSRILTALVTRPLA